jgi:hypothetical protein
MSSRFPSARSLQLLQQFYVGNQRLRPGTFRSRHCLLRAVEPRNLRLRLQAWLRYSCTCPTRLLSLLKRWPTLGSISLGHGSRGIRLFRTAALAVALLGRGIVSDVHW